MSMKRIAGNLVARVMRPRMIWGFGTKKGGRLSNVRISTSSFIDHSDNLVMGDHVFIGHFNFLEASQGLTMGEGCQITNFITITTHSSHDAIRLYGRQYTRHGELGGNLTGAVRIGEYSFVGPIPSACPEQPLERDALSGLSVS